MKPIYFIKLLQMKKAATYCLPVIAFMLFSVCCFAQSRTVTGTVKDEKTNTPLTGASISVKGSSANAITDADGTFKLSLPAGKQTLTISFVSYESKTVTISAADNSVAVSLGESNNQLNDVVVVGYGTQKKKDLTGSVSSVKGDDLTLGGTTSNVAQAMQGKAAGVQVQQSNMAPGADLQVIIRGGNSFQTTNAPLFVVDGFISDNGSRINPNDIEDIQILKDASAAAIYGARGGNGVVLITTKKGKPGRIAIEGDISNGVQYLTYKPALLTGQQYTDIQNATAQENGTTPPFPSSFPVTNTNWWDQATQQANVLNRGVSVSSNDKNSKIYVSGNYIKQTGVLKHTGFERYTLRIGAEKNLNDNIKLGANFYGSSSKTDQQSYSGDITAPLFSILTAQPNIPVYNADGSYYKYQGKNNALANLLEPTNNSANKLVNGNVYLDYQLFKNLTFHFSGGAEYSQTTAGQYIPRTLTAGQANNGIGAEQMNTSFRWLNEEYFTYKGQVGLHDFTAILGTSAQKDVYEGLGAGASGFPTDLLLYYDLSGGSIYAKPASSKIETKIASIFTRINYTYNDNLLATFTLRRDGSSRFGADTRHGYFPSGAVAYKLSSLDFIQNLHTFSNLKFRVGYGITGNDRIPDYAFLSRLSTYSTVLTPGGPLQTGLEPASLANDNLKWEKTAQLDVGLDMGFLNGRLNATVDYYHKKTTDLLLNVPVGQWWGFSSQLLNSGSIVNQGVEIGLTSTNVKTKELAWNTNFNIAFNRQKCVALADNVKLITANTANPSGTVSGQVFTKVEPGKELGLLYGYRYAGVIKTGETYAPQPNSKPGDAKYVDVNGDGKITPDDRDYLGNTNPRIIAGIGSDIRYRSFSLNFFFQGAFDYSLYNMNRLVLESTTGADALNRWVATKNENTDIPREGYFKNTYGSYVNSRFVENATYVRLKSVSLSYDVPVQQWFKLKFLDALRLYVSGQNLFTITGYTGTDPEVNVHATGNATSTNIGGGLDFGAFPAFRTFSFGAKITIH